MISFYHEQRRLTTPSLYKRQYKLYLQVIYRVLDRFTVPDANKEIIKYLKRINTYFEIRSEYEDMYFKHGFSRVIKSQDLHHGYYGVELHNLSYLYKKFITLSLVDHKGTKQKYKSIVKINTTIDNMIGATVFGIDTQNCAFVTRIKSLNESDFNREILLAIMLNYRLLRYRGEHRYSNDDETLMIDASPDKTIGFKYALE